MCRSYGNICSCKAIIDKATNACRGYGFVDFDSAEVADAAVRGLQASGYQVRKAWRFTDMSMINAGAKGESASTHESALATTRGLRRTAANC